MQIWAESGKSALPICNYSQILYQFLTFTQNLKRSPYKKCEKDVQSLNRNSPIRCRHNRPKTEITAYKNGEESPLSPSRVFAFVRFLCFSPALNQQI